MTTPELQAELASIKAMVAQLQVSVIHLSSLIAAEQPETIVAVTETKWLTLAGESSLISSASLSSSADRVQTDCYRRAH